MCVRVVFITLPALKCAIAICVDEICCCCFKTKFYPKSGSSLREKSESKRKLQKKTSNNQQPLQIYSHKSSSSSSVDVHGYATLNMNEEEIEQLARENFSRRIRAIAMESLLLEKTKVEKKKTKKEGKEEDDWKSLRKNADDDDDFKDDEKTKNAFMNARKEMARGLGISARAFQSAAEMLSQEDRAVNAAPTQKEEETKNVEENDAPEVDDDERRKRMAMMEEIAKRVCMENEKKVRARERLAVVDTILEVLKDAEGER